MVFIGLLVLGWLLAGRPTVAQPEPQETLSDTYGTASYAHHILKLPGPYYFMRGVFFGKSSTPEMKKVPTAQNPGAPIYSWPGAHCLIVGERGWEKERA